VRLRSLNLSTLLVLLHVLFLLEESFSCSLWQLGVVQPSL